MPHVPQNPAQLDLDLPNAGYAWWYLDGLSDDGSHGITLIAFIGSVFSPYYYSGRRRGRNDPREYCALNICVYGPRRWTMTERSRSALQQSSSTLGIGPSEVRWEDDGLTIDFNELGAPIPRRVRGQVRLHPQHLNERVFNLDQAGRHHWRPVAPSARIEVDLQEPALRWSGHGYFDRNWGDEQIEDGFIDWDWSRAELRNGSKAECAILYDVNRRQGGRRSLALRFTPSGVEEFEPPRDHQLPKTPIWRMPRASQADSEQPPKVTKTLEDTPFYSRSVIETRLLGHQVLAMHESLSLERFRSPIVQRMLPYRMRRQRT